MATAAEQVDPSIPVTGIPEPDPTPARPERLRKQRTCCRRKISTSCRQLERTLQSRGSRGGVKALLAAAKLSLQNAEKIEDMLTDEIDSVRQLEQHAQYVELVGKAEEEVEKYLLERADDPESVAGRPPSRLPDDGEEEGQPALPGIPLPALLDNPSPATHNDSVALNEFIRSNPTQGQAAPTPDDLASQWRRQQRLLNAQPFADRPPIQETPDDWIDDYRNGLIPPSLGHGHGARSSVKAELTPFSGKALEWFGWIDLFRALVHDTGKAPGEKLAILKTSLRGDCLTIVYGLGGGEAAYMEALVRLKQSYGRRDVMRAAHLQAIDRLEMAKQEPTQLKRFAETVRTHLFDLSRIGETSSSDLIERVCQKLSLHDRLAWYEGRGSSLETRSLNDFGAWLCNRAAGYQNAYSLASDQLNPSGPRHRDRYNARTNQTSAQQPTSRGGSGSRPTSSGNPFCFNCEQGHRLEDCKRFKELPLGDRLTFCNRHRLCYGCLGTKHNARDCKQRRQCKFADCKLFHHPLLHNNVLPETRSEPPPSSSAHNNSARGEETAAAHNNSTLQAHCKVALGVIQAEALGADGETALINIMYDEGSDTTLFREGLVPLLKLAGRDISLSVDGVGGTRVSSASKRVQLKLRSATGEVLEIEGSTLPSVTKPVPVTDWNQIKERWAHLADLPLKKTGGRIDVLLGLIKHI